MCRARVERTRYYDWAWLADVGADGDPDDNGAHSVLIRRNNTTGELGFYRCWAPGPVTLTHLVRIAGMRWMVEESFQAGKGQAGLDQHQVRRWNSWHRFTTLALAALAILAICAAETTSTEPASQLRGRRPAHGEPVVDCALSLLATFDAEHRSLSVGDLSRRTGIPKSSATRLARQLKAWGAFERCADGRYVIGLRLWQTGALAPRGHGLQQIAMPYLGDLAQATR